MRCFPTILLITLLISQSNDLWSQRSRRDTTGSVDIVSSFKPILRDPVKIQFAAQPPVADTTRVKLNYRIPSQELSISYQPGSLKPLAYQSDSNHGFSPAQFVKLGYGNLRNPYASVAMEFGNKFPVRLYADHRSASGKLPFQDYSITQGKITWQLPDRMKGEWLTALEGERQAFSKFGFDGAVHTPPVDSVRQVYHHIGLNIAYRRVQPTASGFYVEPSIDLSLTGDRQANRDLNARVWVPIRIALNDDLMLRVNGLAHVGRILQSGKTSIDLSVYSINPSFRYERTRWSAQVGIRPSWDANGVRMYPDVQFQWNDRQRPWSLLANWSGELQRIGYRGLYTTNPWLWMPAIWRSRGEIDRSIRWQYNRRSDWSYHIQAGYATISDPFLFINDTTQAGDGKSFGVVYAEQMRNLYATAGFTYRRADRWLLQGSARWNNYHALKGQERPWGLLPFEWKLNGVYNLPKRIRLQADVYSWFAPFYLTKTGQASRTDGAIDLNIGAEMPVTRTVRAWIQFNNLLNRPYERWHQYPVYGFHFVGGVVFSLDKKIP